MTVEEAIEKLKKLPKGGILMVPSEDAGGSVPIKDFIVVDLNADVPWIDVMLGE